MATTRLAPDFKEFLQLLLSAKIEYLLIGGYAVGHYGFPRATGDNKERRFPNRLCFFSGSGRFGKRLSLRGPRRQTPPWSPSFVR
jgi:hypothetical protein